MNRYRSYILFFLLLIQGFTSIARADGPSADIRERYPFAVTFVREDRVDSLIRYADTDLVPIIFKRDKTDLLLPNALLDSVVDVCNRIFRDSDIHPAYVWIGGSASPEGPYDHNVWLGKTRAKRLYDYLMAHATVPDSLIRIDNLCEDWNTPLRLLAEDDFPHKAEVLQIYRTESDNAVRKKKIMAIDKGVTWEYLIDNQFRPARNARMVIVCTYPRVVEPVAPAQPVAITGQKPAPMEPVLRLVPQAEALRYNFIAVKTNLAALGLLVANLGVEFSFADHFSLDLPVYYSPYDITDTFRVRILGTQPEVRYWFNSIRPGDGHFVGVNGTVAGFDISFPGNSRRFQDPEHALWGAGISYGYALNFGAEKRWGLEFNLGVGYFNYKYDTFANRDNGPLLKTSGTVHQWGITRVGINLTYKWWRTKKQRATRHIKY